MRPEPADTADEMRRPGVVAYPGEPRPAYAVPTAPDDEVAYPRTRIMELKVGRQAQG
jgi:hypothetical protein